MALLTLEPLSIDASPSMFRLSAGVIQGLPQLDQNNEPTADHLKDENARMNCVFTSNAAVSRKIGGHPEATGDAIKDACAHYGQNYTGGADEEVVASDGCLDRLWGIHADTFRASTRNALLNECKRQADLGNFTIITIPSAWGSQPSLPGYNPNIPTFYTHAVVYCGYIGDQHYLMNPWGGFIMIYSTVDLTIRLCFLKVYPLRAATHTQEAPMAWHKQADGSGKDDKGNVCGTGVMALLDTRKDLASADGWMRERYRGSDDAVLPLRNGHSIVAHRKKPGTDDWDIKQDDAGGLELLVGIIADQDAAVASRDKTIKDLNDQLSKASKPLTPKQQAAINLGAALDAYEATK